jgi:hypothetical protein
MSLIDEFNNYKYHFDLGKIDANVVLHHSINFGKINQYVLSFKFYAPNHDLFRINFSYSNKRDEFSLNNVYFAATGEYHQETNYINSLDYTKYPRMSLQEAFNFVYSLMQGVYDTLDVFLI